jgi:hypothetical protein
MKIIECDKELKKVNEIDVIRKQLAKMKEKIISHPVYLDDKLSTPKFVTEVFDDCVQIKNFCHDIDITIACAFVQNHTLRIAVLFKYKKKKKTKLIKVIRDFLQEVENLYFYLDKRHISTEDNFYYMDLYRDLDEELS